MTKNPTLKHYKSFQDNLYCMDLFTGGYRVVCYLVGTLVDISQLPGLQPRIVIPLSAIRLGPVCS